MAESLPKEAYTQILINLEKSRTVWVATIEVEISRLEGTRKIAIVMVRIQILKEIRGCKRKENWVM